MKAALFLFLILSTSAQAKGLEEYYQDVSFTNDVKALEEADAFVAASDPFTPSTATPATPSLSKPPQVVAHHAFRKGSFFPRTNSEKCSTINNIQDQLGEVRNQDGLGWCFATMMADLFSAETGQRLSDFEMGLHYFKEYGPKYSVSKLSSGSPFKLARQVVREGSCLEKNLPSNERMIAESAALLEKSGWNQNVFLEAGIRAIENVRGLSVDKLLQYDKAACQAMESAQAMFPGVSDIQILSAITTSASNERLMKILVSYTCERAPLALAPNFRFRQLTAHPEGKHPQGFHLLPSLDKQLKKGKPVGVGYWPSRFFNAAPKDRHTSVIVGREFRDGVCKYLVRNSFGPGCGHYKAPYGKPENCQNGHFWVSEKDFVETADVLEFIE